MRYWQSWLRTSRYRGRWREMVERSALCLKLLVYQPTGALVAAPTTSLPETLGGTRNWDYRFTWVRDAAFTLYALMSLGFTEEAAGVHGLARGPVPGRRRSEQGAPDPLRRSTGDSEVAGDRRSTTSRVPGLAPGPGRATTPPRQRQLDIYGELMDSVLPLQQVRLTDLLRAVDRACRRQLDWLAEHWEEPDDGRLGGPRAASSGSPTRR